MSNASREPIETQPDFGRARSEETPREGAESRNGMKCPECNGKGWNNDLATLLEQTCRSCRGTGQVEPCGRCGGAGAVPHWSTHVPVTCDACAGRGSQPG